MKGKVDILANFPIDTSLKNKVHSAMLTHICLADTTPYNIIVQNVNKAKTKKSYTHLIATLTKAHSEAVEQGQKGK